VGPLVVSLIREWGTWGDKVYLRPAKDVLGIAQATRIIAMLEGRTRTFFLLGSHP
jgi:hypothetical protein